MHIHIQHQKDTVLYTKMETIRSFLLVLVLTLSLFITDWVADAWISSSSLSLLTTTTVERIRNRSRPITFEHTCHRRKGNCCYKAKRSCAINSLFPLHQQSNDVDDVDDVDDDDDDTVNSTRVHRPTDSPEC